MGGIFTSRILSFSLAASALGLGGHLFVQASDLAAARALGTLHPATTAATAEPAQGAPDLDRLDLAGVQADYGAVLDRPLFAMTRRPPEARPVRAPVMVEPIIRASAPEPKAQLRTGQFVLIGVIIENREKRALTRQGRSGEVMRVLEAQVIDGWLVERIEPTAVRFVQDGVVDIVSLHDNAPPSGKPTAAPAAKPRQAKKPPQNAQPKKRLIDRLKPKKHDRFAQNGARQEARRVPVKVKLVSGSR